jgi:hypothetical protein
MPARAEMGDLDHIALFKGSKPTVTSGVTGVVGGVTSGVGGLTGGLSGALGGGS